MDLVHDRGSMDPVHESGPCFVLTRLKYHAECKQYRNYYECEYCPLKSKDRSPYTILNFTEPPSL